MVDYELLLVRRCPHYDTCSAVECPLDVLQGQRGPVGEEICHALRRTRLAIIAEAQAEGIEYRLRHGGRTEAEVAKDKRREQARRQWEALPEAQRAAFTARSFPGRKSPDPAEGVSGRPDQGGPRRPGQNGG